MLHLGPGMLCVMKQELEIDGKGITSINRASHHQRHQPLNPYMGVSGNKGGALPE